MTKFCISNLVAALALTFGLGIALAGGSAEPAITSVTVDNTNVLVKVSVPAGLRKVTVETRSRVDAATWQPKALKRFESPTSDAQEISFTFPHSDKLEVLRVRGDATDALPAQFFKGTNQFAGPQSSGNVGPGGVTFDGNAPPDVRAPGAESRTV